MACWHIQRPMTPVPIQPILVLPASALLIAMSALLVAVGDEEDGRAGCPVGLQWRWRPVMLIPRLDAPLVLVHGLFGFDWLGLGPVGLDYFMGIPRSLREAGNRVLVPSLS